MLRRTHTLLLCLGAALGCGDRAATPPAATEVRAQAAKGELPRADPASPAWGAAPELLVKLLLQDQAPPKLDVEGVAALRVRALSDGKWLALRLEWDDPTLDERAGPARFADMAAVQFPAEAGTSPPDAAMGQAGRPVRIHLWKAASEARLRPGDDPVKALYPNSLPDHHPPEAAKAEARGAMEAQYAPAQGAKNLVAVRRTDSPTEDLLAEGFGTLSPAAEQISLGKGVHDGKRWQVVISRPLDQVANQALVAGTRTYVAFAVWQGAQGNVGSRKMRSGWLPLSLEVKP